MLGGGLLLLVTGMATFGFDTFWMGAVGIPLMGLGAIATKFAYMGTVARYVAGETAPVATDTINYVVEGTRESLRDVVGAIRGDHPSDPLVDCPTCHTQNDRDAKFCDNCGEALARGCASCGKVNDADAKFCDGCGKSLRD